MISCDSVLPRSSRARQRGFTLLEALVTLVIVSVGLLGVLGLQTVSIANTQVSAARSLASLAAENMADRMRANPLGEANDAYENISHPAAGSKPKDCASNLCTVEEVAAYDAWEWDASLDTKRSASGLPDGRGYVACERSTDGDCRLYRITVVWRERDLEAERLNGAKPDQCDSADFTDRCFATLVRP